MLTNLKALLTTNKIKPAEMMATYLRLKPMKTMATHLPAFANTQSGHIHAHRQPA